MSILRNRSFTLCCMTAMMALSIAAHAYPENQEECKAAEGTWIDFKTTPPDGWCKNAKAMPNGPIMICAKAKGLEKKVGNEMVCMPRDPARLKLLLEHDV